MSITAGKVTAITGMVQAKDPITGEVRVLKQGDEIQLGDVIITSVNGNVTISLENGDLLTLGRDTQMALDEDVVGATGMTDPVTEATVDVAGLQQAVLEGNFEGLGETAAGPAAGDAGAGGSANAGATNTVDRIGAEGEVTSGYETNTASVSSAAQEEQAGNVAPEVTPEVATVYEDTIVQGQIDFTDESNETVTVNFAEGTAIPEGFSLNADGSYTLDANSYDYLAVDQTEEYVLPIVLTDGDGAQTESTLTVTVIGTNDAPILVADTSGSITETVATETSEDAGDDVSVRATEEEGAVILTDNGELSFSDVDLIDTHTMSASYNNDAVWSGGDLTPAQIDAITADFTADLDSWQYSVANSEVQFLAEGQTIQFSYDVTVDDSHGGTDTEAVVITITGTNSVPTILGSQGEVVEAGNLDDGTVVLGTPVVTGTMVANDVDSGATLSFSGNADSPYGAFSIDENTGEWTYTLDNEAANTLAEGEQRTESFTVTVRDEFGAEAVEEVVITINGTNDSPTAEDATFGSDTNTVEFSLADYTSDIEDGLVTDVKVTSLPEYGYLYVGTEQLSIGDQVADPTTIRYEIDPDLVSMYLFDATKDFKDEGYADDTVSTFTTEQGLVVSGGTFTGNSPDASSTLTAANLYYDGANKETGLGIGKDKELNSSAKEYISIEFPGDVISSVVSFGSVYGNYQDTHKADAQINIIALKGGKVVLEESFNDTYNNSGIFEAPVTVEGGYDEIRVFTQADKNSNITLQSVEVTNMGVEDSFDYQAVDSVDAYDPATVTLTGFVYGKNVHELYGDEALLEVETLKVEVMGEDTVIYNLDNEDDYLDLSDIIDSSKVTEDNVDQYLKLAHLDTNGDGEMDSSLLIVDSNGDAAGGETTNVYIAGVVSDSWKVYLGQNDDGDHIVGDFDLDN